MWQEKLPRVFQLAWAQILLAFGAGVALSYYFEAPGRFEILHHIGIGLIVAAVVTTFWQFREFEEFFAKFSRRILVEDAYLEKLKTPSLTALRSRAGRAILKEFVNNPAYQRESLGDWIDDLLYRTLMPSQTDGSGLYREDYTETVCLEHVRLVDALKAVGADTSNIRADALEANILKVTSITTYRVVAPRLEDNRYSCYTVRYTGNGAGMRYFPAEYRIVGRVGHTADTARTLAMHCKDTSTGGIAYNADPITLEFDKATGTCNVWVETVEYRDTDRESYVLSTMALLTRDVNVHVYYSGSTNKLNFDGGMLASGRTNTIHGPNSYGLRHTGWLFEDHGFYVWWWYR